MFYGRRDTDFSIDDNLSLRGGNRLVFGGYMSSNVRKHRLYGSNVVFPPIDDLERFIDRTEYAGAAHHWYWLGEFFTYTVALSAAPVPITARYDWYTPGASQGPSQYVVVRLLLAQEGEPLPLDARVRHLCGVATCVNPSHYEVCAAVAPYADDPSVWPPPKRQRRPAVRTQPRAPLGLVGAVHCVDPFRVGLTVCNRPLDVGPVTVQPGIMTPEHQRLLTRVRKTHPHLRAVSSRVGVTCSRCNYELARRFDLY